MVREYSYFVADAYTEQSFIGNPSGIILTQGKMSDEAMQKAACELKHSETSCIQRLDKDIYAARYFSPVREVVFSGHSALSAFWTLAEFGYIDGREDVHRVLQHTKAGTLYVDIAFKKSQVSFVDVQLPKMKMGEEIKADAAAEAFQLEKEQIGIDALVQPAVIDGGVKTLVIPLKKKAYLQAIEPKRRRMEELTKAHGVRAFHLFYYERETSTVYQRNFSPSKGIWEESGTGTGSGAMYVYLREKTGFDGQKLACIQGVEMGRESKIVVREKEKSIYVGGTARVVMEGIMRI